MDQSESQGRRTIEQRSGNRDALIEGNIVADERQLDPDADVGADETGSDRMRGSQVTGTGDADGVADASGTTGPGREQAADDTLKDGSIPADADLDMPSDAMNEPDQLENGSGR